MNILKVLLLLVTGFAVPRLLPEDVSADRCERLLRDLKIGTNSAALIAFLERNSAADADNSRIPDLLKELGAAERKDWELASKKLLVLGYRTVPQLRSVMALPDATLSQRAKWCLDSIFAGPDVRAYSAAVQVLLRRSPPRTAETLLRYLPCAPTDTVEDAICFGLYAWAKQEGKLPAVFLEALKDPVPARRALAGLIVARLGGKDDRAAARALLKDAQPEVRLRVAQGFLAVKDPSAVPVLIDLLTAAPLTSMAWQAEELLHWAAGKGAPEPTIGEGSVASRQKCQAAWKTWWGQTGGKLNTRQGGLRPILLLRQQGEASTAEHVASRISPWPGALLLHGSDGKVRWQLLGTSGGTVQFLAGDRLLLAEKQWRKTKKEGGRRVPEPGPENGVTERDLAGKILWQYKPKDFISPVAAVRLPGGVTLVMQKSLVRFVDPNGALICEKDFRKLYQLPAGPPQLLADGRLVVVHHPGTRLDSLVEGDLLEGYRPTTQVRKPAPLQTDPIPVPGLTKPQRDTTEYLKPAKVIRPREPGSGGHPFALENGNYLLAGINEKMVYELNPNGERVWHYRVSPELPVTAVRLPGGCTLIYCSRGQGRLLEVCPNGYMGRSDAVEAGRSAIILALVRLGFEE